MKNHVAVCLERGQNNKKKNKKRRKHVIRATVTSNIHPMSYLKVWVMVRQT